MLRLALAASLLGFILPVGAVQAQRSWMVVEAARVSDDQPREATRLQLEYGRFLRPHLTLAATAEVDRLAAGLSDRRVTAAPGLSASVGVSGLRLGLNGSGRALVGGPEARAVPLGDARASLGLGEGLALRAGVARERYTSTAASVDTLVLMNSAEVALDRAGAPGWAAEAVLRREDFGDSNPILTAFGWMLAPLSRSAEHVFRAGYAVVWQDADRSSWQPRPDPRPARGGPAGPVDGWYAPYYTPHQLLTHSVLANGALAVGGRWLKAEAAYGVQGRELAPELSLVHPGEPSVGREFRERSFTPYRAKASWSAPLDEATWLIVAATYHRTASYRVAALRLSYSTSR
jgi:hypothetical protein